MLVVKIRLLTFRIVPLHLMILGSRLLPRGESRRPRAHATFATLRAAKRVRRSASSSKCCQIIHTGLGHRTKGARRQCCRAVSHGLPVVCAPHVLEPYGPTRSRLAWSSLTPHDLPHTAHVTRLSRVQEHLPRTPSCMAQRTCPAHPQAGCTCPRATQRPTPHRSAGLSRKGPGPLPSTLRHGAQ